MDSLHSFFQHLLETRRTTSPKRLVAPGPNATEFEQIVGAAAHAPDHGQLTPWRLIVIPHNLRAALGQAFRTALADRDGNASPQQLTQAAQKAERAPLLMAAVVSLPQKQIPEVPLEERLISQGCALQNLLLMATALGYASALTSGKALNHAAMRQLLQLQDNERLSCFVNIGTATTQTPVRRRPQTAHFVSTLAAS